MPTRKKTNYVDHSDVRDDKDVDLGEIKQHEQIEKVSENDFYTAAEEEAFMNEILTIEVAEAMTDEELDIIVPAVNGVNQPIIRGREAKVKRKYVEALARSRVTTYKQETYDPTRPDQIKMVARTSVTYPFQVLHDPNPKGRAWLNAIKAQYA